MVQFLVSCKKVSVNFDAIGEETLIFPEGKTMHRHQILENGFEYEVRFLMCQEGCELGFSF